MSTSDSLAALPNAKRVLVVSEEVAFAEMLAESLLEAGHLAQLASPEAVLAGEVSLAAFAAAIVDLDTSSRNARAAVDRIRAASDKTMVIALLPCGGLPTEYAATPYHLAIAKPARLKAVLTAIAAAGA
jgi:ActR/RegA family two-component response regulator